MLRRVICFIMVLAICAYLPSMAFAATSSPGENNNVVSGPTSIGGNPKTGDMIMTWVIIMVLALLALAVVFILYRKFAR